MRSEKILLNFVGVLIQLNFHPTKDNIAKDLIKKQILEIWGTFFEKKVKKPDFSIDFKDLPMFVYTSKNKNYYFGSARNKTGTINVNYFISVKILDMLFKEIVNNCIEDDGLIIHSSSVVDKKGVARIFLAKSGGGKSTTSDNLIGKFKKISDDSVILRKVNSKWVLFTPPTLEKKVLPRKYFFQKVIVYSVKKSPLCSVKPIDSLVKKVKVVTNALWLSYGKVSKKKLDNVINFCECHEFFILNANLNKRDLQKIL